MLQVPNASGAVVTARCNAGEQAIGGGVLPFIVDGVLCHLSASGATPDTTDAWNLAASCQDGSGGASFFTHVICLQMA